VIKSSHPNGEEKEQIPMTGTSLKKFLEQQSEKWKRSFYSGRRTAAHILREAAENPTEKNLIAATKAFGRGEFRMYN
jgi:hypothetical protein